MKDSILQDYDLVILTPPQFISDNVNYEYDLLGALKSNLVEKFYIDADEECPDVTEMIALAARINEHAKDVDAVLMPAVVGLTGCSDVVRLKEKIDRPLHFIATLPPSVPGIRLQMMLKKHFQKLGGVYMLGDSVVSGEFEDGKLKSINRFFHIYLLQSLYRKSKAQLRRQAVELML